MTDHDPWSRWIAAQRSEDERDSLAPAVVDRLGDPPASRLSLPWWVAAFALLAVRAALGLVVLIAT